MYVAMNGTAIGQSASTLTSVTNIYTFAVSMDIVLIRSVATIVNAKPDNSTWPDVGITCVDVDECFFDKQYCENRPDWCQPQNCFLGAHCDNTEGSFLCTCPEGMNGNGTHCEDIDECDEWLHSCDPINGLHLPLFVK